MRRQGRPLAIEGAGEALQLQLPAARRFDRLIGRLIFAGGLLISLDVVAAKPHIFLTAVSRWRGSRRRRFSVAHLPAIAFSMHASTRAITRPVGRFV
jgi:hypothetical protein